MYGDIKLLSGTACPHLAADIARYLNQPLGRRDILKFPNENIFTDTIAIPPKNWLPHLRVLSIAPLLGEVIRRVHEGRRVGEMFNE